MALKQDISELITAANRLTKQVDALTSATETQRGLVRIASGQEIEQGTATDLAVTPAQMHQQMSTISPTGAVSAFAGTTPPKGWLECNGAAVSRSDYRELFAQISTQYGAGDGSATFNLPDLRGEFIRGFDHGRGVDKGRGLGTDQADALQNIKGKVGGARYDNADNDASGAFSAVGKAGNFSGGGGQLRYIDFDASRVVRTSNETRPRNVALMYCIKY